MSHGIRRILCCVGLKIDCDPVLAHAVGLAVATGAELEVLHAVKSLSDDVVSTLRANIPDRKLLETLREQRLEEASKVLDEKIAAFWAGHPELEAAYGDREMKRHVLEGYPAAVITDHAHDRGSDMIVMASNKRSFSASYAGKITKGVIKRSHVPVVVVPPRRD
ncbi:Universal stress protein family protein [Halomonas sp. THAF5a]|uniref:universal stress protein n=1 Tax=Halomonas sp. THAF5a TaxID=2587844 RepID=UPI0012A84443|nr:universal stress protein [Halomonas sp. THAF5a]QFU01161.1 Universal stress protein family protein [Halomonas sp. THAF5a]